MNKDLSLFCIYIYRCRVEHCILPLNETNISALVVNDAIAPMNVKVVDSKPAGIGSLIKSNSYNQNQKYWSPLRDITLPKHKP